LSKAGYDDEKIEEVSTASIYHAPLAIPVTGAFYSPNQTENFARVFTFLSRARDTSCGSRCRSLRHRYELDSSVNRRAIMTHLRP
jgi:hypothetical protein